MVNDEVAVNEDARSSYLGLPHCSAFLVHTPSAAWKEGVASCFTIQTRVEYFFLFL
jgi:hypothetical protein